MSIVSMQIKVFCTSVSLILGILIFRHSHEHSRQAFDVDHSILVDHIEVLESRPHQVKLLTVHFRVTAWDVLSKLGHCVLQLLDRELAVVVVVKERQGADDLLELEILFLRVK